MATLSIYKICAQGQFVINQYIEGKQYYNPAAIYTDRNDKFNIIALYNRGLSDGGEIKNTGIILANMSINFIGHKNIIGLEFNTYKSKEYKYTELSSSYSWVEVLGKVQINIASGVIFRNTSFDNTKADSIIYKNTIPKITGKGVDLSLGTFIQGYNTFIGISVRNVLNTNIRLSDYYKLSMTRFYNFILGYNFRLSNLRFTPSTLFTINDDLSYRADFNLSSWYKEKFAINLGYRYKDSFSIGLETKLLNFQIGYSLILPKDKLSQPLNWGTHEFFVSYAFDINKSNYKRNIFKSIRLL